MLSFSKIQDQVIYQLNKGLSHSLTYHNVAHTLDVLKYVIEIARLEGITNEEDLLLLKISALYHDIGFLTTYSGHEEVSCVMASEELENYGFSKGQIAKICGMIRATKVPQQPQNQLEEIICDADLDYLGRDDFFSIGEGLYKEFLQQKIVTNDIEWNELQVRFLENHHYFTKSSKQNRQQAKQANLEKVKGKLV